MWKIQKQIMYTFSLKNLSMNQSSKELRSKVNLHQAEERAREWMCTQKTLASLGRHSTEKGWRTLWSTIQEGLQDIKEGETANSKYTQRQKTFLKQLCNQKPNCWDLRYR